MGRLSQGILGGISGKVGSVVGTSWKGIAVIKAMPLSVANPRTAAQVSQRSKMSFVVLFAQAILSGVIKPLNDRFAVKQSGYNLFVSRNIALFGAAVASAPSSLRLSVGKMVATVFSIVTATVALGEVEFAWSALLPDAYAMDTDKCYIVVQNERNGAVSYAGGVNTRLAGGENVSLPEGTIAGDTINCWLSFLRADGTVVSNTSFTSGVVSAS